MALLKKDKEKDRNLVAEATKEMHAGKYGRASALLKEILAAEPGNLEARRLFGTLHLKTGNLVTAKGAFDTLVKTAIDAQDYWLAESLLREYLAAGPRYIPFLGKLGEVLERKGDPAGAAVEYGKAIEVLVEDPDPDQPTRAAELFSKIKSLAPTSPVARRWAQTFEPPPTVEPGPEAVDVGPPILPAPETGSSPEKARLAALRQFELLDTPPEEVFDELVRAATTLCKTPVALLELVDQDRSWFKAKVGVEIAELPRDHAFADQAMLEDDVLIVPDATADERFAAWLPVIGEQPIRFYAGMPLVTRSGYAIGALSVVDFAPRELTRQQTEWLRILSQQVVHELEGRLCTADLTQVAKELDEQASSIGAAGTVLRQRVSDLHQRHACLEALVAERAGLLTRALQQLRVELTERILVEMVVKQREEELCQLQARLDELTTERTAEVVRVTEQVEQEMAARQRAEQTLLQREGEWGNHRTYLEGLIAAQTSEMVRVNEQIQGQRDELAQLNEALLNRGERLGRVEQRLHDLVQGIRQELERHAEG